MRNERLEKGLAQELVSGLVWLESGESLAVKVGNKIPDRGRGAVILKIMWSH